MIRRLLREPLLHFAAVTAVLFALNAVVSDDREVIRVDAATAQYLLEQREALLQRPLAAEERTRVVDEYLDEEVLVREAYKRGLDRDGRIRRALIRKMRYLLAADETEPTREELRAWFAQNADRYRLLPQLSFENVFFTATERAPANLLPRLEVTGGDALGDFDSLLGRTPRDRSLSDLTRLMGESTAKTIFALEEGRWHGPIESVRGVHFVRITDRKPARRLTFEEVEAYIGSDWALALQRGTLGERVAELRKNYRILRPGPAP